MSDTAVAVPADKKAPPRFKQRAMRTFRSKALKSDDIPMICSWEAFGDMELSDLAKYGIV
uniref:3',5'-cyclic-GMP phosphodiesterase n=1 Tax=Sander lucioperca TaxID=283035 RepID=A0A8D0CXJ7_SANLU